MQIDTLAIKLRPRSMPEASDLGLLLVQQHARSIWLSFVPVWALLLLLAVATVEIRPWLMGFTIFWLKPWLDRSLLFILSRAVFGQPTRFADLWANRSALWWSQLLMTLTWRRLSPWRAFTQAIYQLEGQRGKASLRRRKQLLSARRGAAFTMHFVFANAETVLALGAVALIAWFAPEGTRTDTLRWIFDNQELAPSLTMAGLYALVVLLLEPFYVAAGFAMYLNRRVELEAWDIEQDFRHAFAR